MKERLTILFMAVLCCLFVGAQPMARPLRPHSNHHTHRLPGVNEHRLARLEKMREANLALRHQSGPRRVNTQPQMKRGLVLLVEFSDVSMKSGAVAQWNNRFNQQGYSLSSHVGSVRDYFIEQSYGLLTIDFDIVGPLTLSKTRTYYGSSSSGNLDDRAAEMVIDALKLANSQVNFADYDWDGDNWVDQVYVIYAGITKANTQGYIWPHEWELSSAKYWGCGSGRQTMDGVYIDTYAVSNELADANTYEGIGTACHEFSHCLGYPDFYDTDYSGGTAGQYWDLLDAGSYNGPRGIGEIPCPYTAYERWTAGWIDLIPLTEACKVDDMPAINEEGVAYVIKNTGNSNEYYILENRQKVTFGKGNGGHGLMVWHIDYNQSIWNRNDVNADKDHQRMTFLPADGKVGTLRGSDSEGYSYYVTPTDEAGDPYPGSKRVTSVQQLTWFTKEKNGTKTHQNLIHDIVESSDGKISFIYGDYMPLSVPELAMPTEISETSFTANWMPVEGATSYTLQVETLAGGDNPTAVLDEDFSNFSNASEDATIGSAIINSYTKTPGWTLSNLYGTGSASVRIGTRGASGYLTTPVLENGAGTLSVDFDAAYYSGEGSSVIVTVLNGAGTETIALKTIALTADRASYNCVFENVPAGCKVSFSSTAARQRVYLYSVRIMDMGDAGNRLITLTGITTTSYVVDITSWNWHYYRVQAVCGDKKSDWSDWMDVDIASSIAETPVSFEGGWGEVYDLSGRRLPCVPRHGMYILGGKIHVVK